MGRLKAGLVACLLAIAMSVAGASPAAAACSTEASKGSTWTFASEDGCGQVQARILRYYGGIWTYDGPQLDAYSFVEATLGTNAGNYYRYSNPGWTVWIAV